MALTIRPDGRTGAFQIIDPDGTVIGYGMARASKAEPGYVTLVSREVPLGWAIRVPADWFAELAKQRPSGVQPRQGG